MNRRRRSFVINLLMGLDGIAIAVSFVLAYALRDKFIFPGLSPLLPFSVYFPYLGTVLAVWLLLLRSTKNYSFIKKRIGCNSRMEIFLKLILVEVVGLAFFAMVLFFLRDNLISRTFLGYFGAVNYVFLGGIRVLAQAYFRRINQVKKYHRRVLVLGGREEVEQFIEVQAEKPELLLDIVTLPDPNPPSLFAWNKKEWQSFNERALEFIFNNVVDEVLFVFHDLKLSKISSIVNTCGRLGIMVNVVLDISTINTRKTEIDIVGPYNIISFQSYDYSPPQRFFKHLIDIVAGIVGSFIFCILAIFIAPLIKITSSGPVLFRQTRKGKNGREFQLLKFRTMYADAEEKKKKYEEQNEMDGHIFKIKDDPRVTSFGRFLRKTSLDEFPQFINILKGEMSLVGTRPPTVDEFNSYEIRHRRRLSIRPGLTGLWQVSGRSKIFKFEDIVKLDTDYIDNWTLWLDIKIILKTFTVLFSGR